MVRISKIVKKKVTIRGTVSNSQYQGKLQYATWNQTMEKMPGINEKKYCSECKRKNQFG